MSLELVYSVGAARFSMLVRDDEIRARVNERYPAEAEILWGFPDSGEFPPPGASVPWRELVGAVERVLAAFETDPALTPRRYVFDLDIVPGFRVTGHTEVWSVRLPGKDGYYQLLGGIDQCVLRKVVLGPEPFPLYSDPVDVRDQDVIETESHGPIEIRSTKKRSPIVGDLKKLRRFLESHPGETVRKELR